MEFDPAACRASRSGRAVERTSGVRAYRASWRWGPARRDGLAPTQGSKPQVNTSGCVSGPPRLSPSLSVVDRVQVSRRTRIDLRSTGDQCLEDDGDDAVGSAERDEVVAVDDANVGEPP